jgi:hypothetical protein
MSDDVQIHPNSPVDFEHWCGHEGCIKWGSFRERARPRPDRVALPGPLTITQRLLGWAPGCTPLAGASETCRLCGLTAVESPLQERRAASLGA